MWYIIQKCLQSAYFYFFLFYVFVLYIGQILLESIFCRAKSWLSFPWLFPYQWFVVFFLCNCLKYSFFLTVFLLLHLLFHYFELLFSCHIEKIVFFAPVSFPYELFHSLQFVSPYLFSFTFKQFFYYVILSNYSLFYIFSIHISLCFINSVFIFCIFIPFFVIFFYYNLCYSSSVGSNIIRKYVLCLFCWPTKVTPGSAAASCWYFVYSSWFLHNNNSN